MRKPTRRINLTKKTIEKLAIPSSGRVAVYDEQVHDLGLRIEASGRRSFFWFRKIRGTPTFRAIGTFPETSIDQARGEAHRLSGDLDDLKRRQFQGKNPFEQQRGEPALDDLLTDYCERCLPQSKKAKNPERAAKDARYNFDKYLASWRERNLGQITRKNVIDLHQSLRDESGPYTANRVLQLLRAMFNWAIHPDAGLWSGVNPAAKIALFKEEKRKRFLEDQELARLFAALKKKETNPDLRDFVSLALWTGTRKSDLLAMRWEDAKLEDNRWDIPNSKSGAYTLPLTPEAITILKTRSRSRKNGNPWVFPSFGTSGHIVDLKRAWKDLLTAAKITGLRQHDLRRTLASWQAKQGSSLLVIAKSLGHTSVDATEVYARLDTGAVRTSIEAATSAMIAAGKKKPRLAQVVSRG